MSPEVADHIDHDSTEWLERLGSSGRDRDVAIGELHALLVRELLECIEGKLGALTAVGD